MTQQAPHPHLRFHQRDTLATLHILRRILPTGQVHGREDVRCMGVEATHRARHSRANQILAGINMHQGRHAGLQHLAHNIPRDDGLCHHRLATSVHLIARWLACNEYHAILL
jgi:hypothetical protein